ncbi:MAG: hypothetical protein RBR86_10140 [Pseudobdellovibrionaceae bacterium]|jgi:hypothetical protein|nr:hypothetical protein [Pseudobdellovibrionaceae bacterium]
MSGRLFDRLLRSERAEFLLHRCIRQKIKINYDCFHKFSPRIATRQDDIHAALNLLYRSYLAVGKIEPNDLELHMVPQTLLSRTEMIVCEYNGQIIGTLSLVKRDGLKLACESVYDIQDVLREGNPVYELSCLAIDIKFRTQSKEILYLLFKAAYDHVIAKQHHNATWLVVANPKYAPVYKALFGFNHLKDGRDVRYYNQNSKTPVNGLYLHLNEARKFLARSYKNKVKEKNMCYFFTEYSLPNFPVQSITNSVLDELYDVDKKYSFHLDQEVEKIKLFVMARVQNAHQNIRLAH